MVSRNTFRETIASMVRPCVHLVARKQPRAYAATIGSSGAVDAPPTRSKSIRWNHVISVDCSYVPEQKLKGALSIYAEFDTRSDQTEWVRDKKNGLIGDLALLRTLYAESTIKRNYEILPPSTEPRGLTSRYVGVQSRTAKLPSQTIGKPLYGLSRDSLPPVEALPSSLDTASRVLTDAYNNKLCKNTPIHKRSTVTAVLGGWRHTPRMQDKYKEYGTLIVSMVKYGDIWLEAWLTPKGTVKIQDITV